MTAEITKLHKTTVDKVLSDLEEHRDSITNIAFVAVTDDGHILSGDACTKGKAQPYTLLGGIEYTRHRVLTEWLK